MRPLVERQERSPVTEQLPVDVPTIERVLEAALELATAVHPKKLASLLAANARTILGGAAADVLVGPQVDGVTRVDDVDEQVDGLAVRSILMAPIGQRGAFGLLRVGARASGAFGAGAEGLIERLAALGAAAFERLRLAEAARDAEARLALERERLTLALETGHMGAWEWDLRADRLHWSPGLERIHGLSSGAFAGTLEAQERAIHPDDRDYVIGELRSSVAARKPHRLEYRIVLPDGSIRWLESHGAVFLDDSGAQFKLTGVCLDVTERRQAQTELLDIVSDGFSVIDRDWRVAYVNEAGAHFTGLRPEQLIGRNLWRAFPEAVGTPIYEQYQHAMHDRQPFSVEQYYAPLDKWFATRAYPSSSGLVVHSQDITARRQLEAQQAAHAALRADISNALTSSKSLDATLQVCCEAAVRHLDAAFARIWLHNPFEKMLELRASAGMYTHLDGAHARVPVGKFKIGLIAEERAPHLTNDVQHDPRVGDRQWAAREGMVAFAGYPLLVDGEVVGVFAMFSKQPLQAETLAVLGPVSDALAQGVKRKQAETALEERARDLQRSNNDLEQFAYVASHDLQEPLRMVSSYLQLIERRYKDKLDQNAHEFIGFAVEGAQRLQRLINDLLSYSRVGRRGGAFSEVVLDDTFRRVLGSLRAALEESGAIVTADPLPNVWGDPMQIEQLLQNLVANGIKFHGSAAPQVHVGVERRGREWRFSVRDNGIGIEPQYFERIFIIFQRLHGRHEYPGTGIGLAICKKIVDRHDGRIWVESQPGAGSTFFFTLPARERTA